LNQRGEYAEALFVHGLGVSAAEGLAEWHHRKIRAELGLEPERGKRYSFGYSACPDLEDQAKLFKLLSPETAIEVTLTSAFQLVPEASTTAIIVHHPAALYYMVKVKIVRPRDPQRCNRAPVVLPPPRARLFEDDRVVLL